MAHYDYGPGRYDASAVHAAVTATGLPGFQGVNGTGYDGPGTPAAWVQVLFGGDLTPVQVGTLDAAVAAAPVPEPAVDLPTALAVLATKGAVAATVRARAQVAVDAAAAKAR